MTELLPCPFCGGEAKLKTAGDYYFVVCMSEDCDTHCTWMYDQDKAIAAWNRRTPLPDAERATLAAKVAELEQELAQAQAGRWMPMPLGIHEIHNRAGELLGYLTLTPMRMSWLSALDELTEIEWGTEYRLCRWQEGSESSE